MVDGVVLAVAGDDELDAFVDGEGEPEGGDGLALELQVAQEVDAVDHDDDLLVVDDLLTNYDPYSKKVQHASSQ